MYAHIPVRVCVPEEYTGNISHGARKENKPGAETGIASGRYFDLKGVMGEALKKKVASEQRPKRERGLGGGAVGRSSSKWGLRQRQAW